MRRTSTQTAAAAPRRPIGSRGYRWSLLALTLLMGAALIAGSVGGFARARRDADTVARATGRQLVHAVARDLLFSDTEPERTLARALEEFADEGLSFAALCEPGGTCEPSAGTRLPGGGEIVPTPPLRSADRRRPQRRGVEPQPVGDGSRWRVVVPAWRGPRAERPPRLLSHRLRELRGARELASKLLVIEYEPRAAKAVRARAVSMLAVGLGAAGLLLTVTAVVWKLSLRAERYEHQLERDRELKKLGEVSAVLGHQLRNPLASLKGHSQLLLEQLPAGSPARQGAETVVAEAARLEVLTNQILDFVRTGTVERRPEPPEALLRSVVERWPEGRVAVDVSGAPSTWPLDRARMEQALANVVDNALGVSPPGEPVRVEAGQSQGRLVVRVLDRGPGLAPEDAERVFEPFYTQRVHGTGLGLALSRRIVEGHGGSISAGPREGGGTEVRIELPRE